MIYNYHTHTTRCHHAVDSDEDYIRCAIKAGIKYLGFSDHVPYMFPDGEESHYRVNMCDAEEYINTIRSLAEKYRDDITINVGFEMEYYPDHFDKMLENARKFGAEYLILGQHFIGNERPNGIGTRAYTENNEILTEYVNNVITAIRSGVFTYIAHPDMIRFEGDENHYQAEMTRLCQAAKQLNVPLEINLHGLSNNRHYPSDKCFTFDLDALGYSLVSSTDFSGSSHPVITEQIFQKKGI